MKLSPEETIDQGMQQFAAKVASGKCNELIAKVNKLQGELATKGVRVAELEASNRGAQAQIEELNKRLEDVITPEQYAKLETEVAKFESLKQQLGDANSKNEKLEKDKAAEKRRADDLDAKLKAKPTDAEIKQLRDDLSAALAAKKTTPPPIPIAATPPANSTVVKGNSSWFARHPQAARNWSIAASVAAIIFGLISTVAIVRWSNSSPTQIVQADQTALIAQLNTQIGEWKKLAESNKTERDAALVAQKTDEDKLRTDDQEIKNLNGQLKELQDKDRVAKVETPPPPAPTPAPAQPEVLVAPVSEPASSVAQNEAGPGCELSGIRYYPDFGMCLFPPKRR